ncbi:type 1 glutamine amidotransferase [uncultured Anaerococcus sp.]|mgnify:CR=1 FL=1|uniref:type 1 glutamine amidotransferase n=1 Tax=uncultured Anaerococcus sp. TaxID=293428 RepID=UPI0026217B2B|nr:adenosylcobyric acid synthase [uncultured Anaerococcus sp.]
MSKINICHLYGNLLNTYGDIGNIMALSHEAKKRGYEIEIEIISLGDEFKAENYDFIFFGGGQDYEQSIVQEDLLKKRDAIEKYIENGGVFLAICGGYQLLGKYYYDAYDNKIDGLHIFDHYTKNQENANRFTGQIKIKDIKTGKIYEGFENHGGVTYLSEDEEAFGEVIEGNGNNGQDNTEGFRYKNTIGTYLHGPLLARNNNLCNDLLDIIVGRK